eukprot:Blabericola_migrator_1__12206@NODE_758_length_6631_cov_135_724863_g542_i0_p2_GENE_NODE_758_length_6631_cov_135_724863_g542_i0NODE_758_length_6631_cov_135_724863_g542_i0_p2_ORF_typecomplete_len381_score57_43EMC1_C/PF07774_13/6_5e20PQQ_2/PF13360_6/0_041_NODE_758_length_6631_cov_135_724863_g542_i024893631
MPATHEHQWTTWRGSPATDGNLITVTMHENVFTIDRKTGEVGLEHVSETQAYTVWSRNLGTIENVAVPEMTCQGKESLITRSDGSILRSVCLDKFAALIVSQEGSDRTFVLLSVSEGSVLHSQRLPAHTSQVKHLLIDNNKVTFMYENYGLHRSELSLIELFTEHRSINRMVALANKLGLGGNPTMTTTGADEAEAIQDGELKMYHETFALDVPLRAISSVALTQTSQRVTSQTLILAVPSHERLYLVPPKMFTARRPIAEPLEDQASTTGILPGGPQDTTPPYDPLLPLVSWKFIPESLTSFGDNVTISCMPGSLESETLVTFVESSLKPLPYYPALKYDSLSEDYSASATLGSLAVLFACVVYAFKMVLTSKSTTFWK